MKQAFSMTGVLTRGTLAVSMALALAGGAGSLIAWGAAAKTVSGERVKLDASMVHSEGELGNPEALVDEQGDVMAGPPSGTPKTNWEVPPQSRKKAYPLKAYIDLGEERALSSIWFYDTNGKEDVIISAGKPGDWKPVATYDCGAYKSWQPVQLDVKTRYLELARQGGQANFTEIALYAYTPDQWAAVQQQQAAAANEKQVRDAAMAKAQAEAKSRPVIDLGDPFGKVTLVDEIDVAAADPGHLFTQSPAGASHVEQILGKGARVLNKTAGEAAYLSFRIGQYKLLKPGARYVLEVEYPEDAPRSMVILNGGDESARGFHTGGALGDAFHPKYVNNNNESVATPLSGKYQTWASLFNLHDRFPDQGFIRGEGERKLTPADGFPVVIAQFSAENLPVSQGAAVSRIRLFEVPESANLNAALRLPPDDLPRRHLFWREEMADGVVQANDETKRGLKDPLDWYRYKANLMQFLGMHTYTKDLLEFGAVQHWNSTPGGGNDWAYFNASNDWWGQIVKIMGDRGFDVLPYYEYAGSKGKHGLGPQRRAKPLTRDDAYTHIKWIESSNADITDPDAYEDFKKMLKITILQYKGEAHFVGAWLRPRSQLPMGFGDATRARFAKEANDGKEITRQQLIDDPALLKKYETWWFGKRRQFLVAMRDYLRSNGIKDATILYTTAAGEPGVSFHTWDTYLVTNDVEGWKKRLAASDNPADQKVTPISVAEVIDKNMYLDALLSPPMNWGKWEINHANPPADPADYKQTEGVLLTEAFNRLYTVSDPRTFDAFRAPSGLAIIRHYSLNENMMFDKADKPKLGYFVADIERAGPYCMMGEAMAMANGDPRFIGYLAGSNYQRGFPRYVRNFDTAFLSLPALPSKVMDGAASDKQVVVRSITTPDHGTYLAVVNTAMTDKENVQVQLPAGKVTDAATGEAIESADGKVTLTMYPYQLRALHVEAAQ
jgi:hypothetical protein